MSIYRSILAVIDLSSDGICVAERARALASMFPGTTLKLLHVVEYVPVEPLSDSLLPAVQIEGELVERARKSRIRTAELLVEAMEKAASPCVMNPCCNRCWMPT